MDSFCHHSHLLRILADLAHIFPHLIQWWKLFLEIFFFPDLSHSDPLRANVTLYEAKSASNDDKGMQTPVVLRVHSWSITCLIGSAPITQLING